ncbi:hypothetical protein GCM10007415_26440 [Parapedobacter pyrenivorans]|uniref:Uncharacterized protein n=1 Tax=Parapedobacter pyrenivorans TaxID=1305674 RepID=A0A917MBU6_9SPHI|nr:hypothetical protein [Parapedobacter pyrenivorans]GGG90604.1 hypothetical protein GCM10007415_26440 [Parapedobacter pyrenivorans]
MMKTMVSNRYTLLLALFSWNCATETPAQQTHAPLPSQDTASLIGDRLFERGLTLKRAQGPSAGTIRPFGDSAQPAVWELAEWGSKFELSDDDKTTEGDCVVYRNDGKAITFGRQSDGMHLSMDVITSTEYKAPRQQNQAWPHLLVEQAFPEKLYLKDLKGLLLKFNGRLTKAEMKMPESAFNPGLHTAQFQLFITIQDLNPNSAYYGDYLWFGIPFYDYRYEQIPLYAAQDVGKGDATGKFIYSLATADYMTGTFHGGNWIEVEKDIYPKITEALELAKKRGYLTGSFFDDFQISGMNLGWEVPGTFDAGFEFKDFDLLAITE